MSDVKKLLVHITALINTSKIPFSEKGADRFLTHIKNYSELLQRESENIAKTMENDNISGRQTDIASERLIKKTTGKWNKLQETLGGIFMGAGIANFFSMTILGQQFSLTGLVATIILIATGAFMIGNSMTKEK